MRKVFIKATVLFSLSILGACSTTQETDTTEQENLEISNEQVNDQAQYLFPQGFSVQQISIQSEPEEIVMDYTDSNWETTGLDDPDSQSISIFAEELLNLAGTPVEKEIEGETLMTVSSSEESLEVSIEVGENSQHVQINEQVFEVEELPLTLNPFDPVFLEESIDLGLAELNEVRVEEEDDSIILNQSTTMNEVETLPFVSGWYVHDVFETEFSIEYYWMNTLLSQLTELKAGSTDSQGETSSHRVTLSDGTSEETLHISEETEDGKAVVYLENKGQTILMPTQVADLLKFDPLGIVDNFVALIPLDAVETVTISSPENNYSIHVDRTFEMDDDETIVNSSFYLNDEEIEEKEFRRLYQYLARLSYSEPLAQVERDQNTQDADISISYEYLNEGDTTVTAIELIPIENSNEYIVERDGITEFKMTDEKLLEMFSAFESLDY